MDDHMRNIARDDERLAGRQHTKLARLEDRDDLEVADGEPDIRGWRVRSSAGTTLGTVDSLIFDSDSMEVRYIGMRPHDDLAGRADDEQVFVPIGAARLNDDEDVVVVDQLPATGIGGAPRMAAGPVTAEHERAITTYYFGSAEPPRDATQRFFGNRRGERTGTYFRRRS